MRVSVDHEIDNEPVPDDVGIIRITAVIIRGYDYLTYTTQSFAKDFLDEDQDECRSKQDLNLYLMQEGINYHDIIEALMNLVNHVDKVTCDASFGYSHECALDVWLEFDFNSQDDIDDGEMEDDQMEDSVQALFDETSDTRFRPASKQVVKSLTRKIYNKKIQKENKKKKKKKIYKEISLEECAICLEEFSDGVRVVTLPCGHDFDDECVVKWLDTNHACPLCRFELPCEKDLWTPVVLS